MFCQASRNFYTQLRITTPFTMVNSGEIPITSGFHVKIPTGPFRECFGVTSPKPTPRVGLYFLNIEKRSKRPYPLDLEQALCFQGRPGVFGGS